MFNNTVYKCDLLSVTPDIKVYTDKSMKSNVMNADTTVVTTLLVQKTFNPSYFKEIVTGRLIPIYRVITYDTNTVLNGKVELKLHRRRKYSEIHIMDNVLLILVNACCNWMGIIKMARW